MFTRLNFEKTKVTEFVPRIFFSQKREREREREKRERDRERERERQHLLVLFIRKLSFELRE